MVYTSGSLSLATLEVLVHLEDPDVCARCFSWMTVGWSDYEINISSRTVSNSWLRPSRSAALAVPPAVTPGEWNDLLDPTHPVLGEIQIGAERKFQPNARLFS